MIPIRPITDDLKKFLEIKLDRDDKPEAMDEDLRADIVRVILDKIQLIVRHFIC